MALQLQRDCFAVITLKIIRYGKDFFFLWKLVFCLCLNKIWFKPWQGKTSDCCFLRQKKKKVEVI